jgi:type I restriction enzyme, S subunit
LVDEQRRLIELLKEKRQAVISHAVTKGLNPHAPMRPSAIEWLGDVPAHWEVVPLKYVVNLRSGGTPSKTNNTKEQFANSPDLKAELMNAIMGALDAHTMMSTQALNSPIVQSGMKDILLNYARLYETLRSQAAGGI